MTRFRRNVERRVGMLPALALLVAALTLFSGIALQNAPAVYAGVVRLSEDMGFGGGARGEEALLIGGAFQMSEAQGQSDGGWHNSYGAVSQYDVKLDSDPNIAASAVTALSAAVNVTITVEDVTIDGMAYDGTALSTSTPDKAPQLLQACVGTCSQDSDWSDTVTVYFATAATTVSSTAVGKWDTAQTIKVRAANDDFDDLGNEKRTRIKHEFTNYSSLGAQYLVVKVTDNDARGIELSATGIGGSSSAGWTQSVAEGSNGDTYIELDVNLESRPQVGPVKLTVTGTQDATDPSTDVSWAKKPAGACSTIGDSTWQSSGSTVTLTYNKSTEAWDTA